MVVIAEVKIEVMLDDGADPTSTFIYRSWLTEVENIGQLTDLVDETSATVIKNVVMSCEWIGG
jgi:hypothetical protein